MKCFELILSSTEFMAKLIVDHVFFKDLTVVDVNLTRNLSFKLITVCFYLSVDYFLPAVIS